MNYMFGSVGMGVVQSTFHDTNKIAVYHSQTPTDPAFHILEDVAVSVCRPFAYIWM